MQKAEAINAGIVENPQQKTLQELFDSLSADNDMSSMNISRTDDKTGEITHVAMLYRGPGAMALLNLSGPLMVAIAWAVNEGMAYGARNHEEVMKVIKAAEERANSESANDH